LANRMKLVSLFAVLAIAVALFALTSGNGIKNADADIVPGEYSLEAETGGVPVTGPFQTTVAIGGSVTVRLRNDHPAPAAPCSGAAGEFGCYQAVQFRLNYDDTILSTSLAAIAKDPAAPAACTSESISPGPGAFVLTGCLSLGGADIDYSGNMFNVTMTCIAPGPSPISLEPKTTSPGTFVNDSAADQPDHLHINDNNAGAQEPNAGVIACVNVADIVAQKALTSPPTVAGGPVQYTVTATNTGPATWVGPVVADDLPDNVNTAGCSPAPPALCANVSIDVNGDSTVDIPNALGCLFIPAISPNPFGLPAPDPVLKAIACPGALNGPTAVIAVGGKMILVANVTSDPDDCNDTYNDVGIGTADSPTAPLFGIPGTNLDPDFLDGIDGTEDNFAPLTHVVGDCPVTVVKTGPSSATVGDTGHTFTLTVSNAGPSQATGVVTTDVVDPGFDVTAVSAGCVEAPANTVTCASGTIAAGGNVVHTITFDTPTAGFFCNEGGATWVRGNGTQSDLDDVGTTTSNEVCFTVLPPYNGIVKAIDLNGDTDTDDPGEAPAAGEDTIEVNLWLCADQSTDGIDNNGDSTVDNEPNTCGDEFVIEEQLYTPADCDSRNDDDDLDGKAVSNSPTIHADEDGVDNDGDTVVDEDGEQAPVNADGIDNDGDTIVDEITEGDDGIDDDGDTAVDEPGEDMTPEVANPDFNVLCPLPTLQDYVDGNVDKDGGELPEGIGAFEFQLKFDHKIFDITIDPSNHATDGIDNDHDGSIDEADEDWANGRDVNCTMTIISENDIRFGCVTTGTTPGHAQLSGTVGALITVSPEADLPFRIRPGKDNGVVRRLLDENCEIADVLGGPLTALQDIIDGIDNDGDTIVDEPNENLQANVGLTPDCTDIDITVRRLEGDLDMDCDVQVTDAQRIAFRYGGFFGQLLYDTFYDLEPFTTPDFDIDIKDLQFVFGRIGSTCDEPIPNSQEPQSANGVGQP